MNPLGVNRKVVVIDSHQFDDNRIGKHIATVSLAYPVFRINLNFYPDRPPAEDDKGIIVDYIPTKSPYLNGALFAVRVAIGGWTGRFLKALMKEFLSSDDEVIIHVHDPYVLGLATRLQGKIAHSCIVYDRHEYYETWKNRLGISAPGLFERFYGKRVEEVVFVSHRPLAPKVFSGKRVSVIPNYPPSSRFSREAVVSKIASSGQGMIAVVYFGVLNLDFDRDIELMFRVMGLLMDSDERVNFVVAGRIYDGRVRDIVKGMSTRFGERVRYLGEISNREVIERTQASHLGLFLLRPDSPMWDDDRPVSPNKIYEYLLSGTVPVIRAHLEDMRTIERCSLTFGKADTAEDISAAMKALIDDRERLKELMTRSFEIGCEFTWEKVSSRYLDCYERLFATLGRLSNQ